MKPPCKKAGVDCPRRCPGCQQQCPEYKDYRALCDRANAQKRAYYEAKDTEAKSRIRMATIRKGR